MLRAVIIATRSRRPSMNHGSPDSAIFSRGAPGTCSAAVRASSFHPRAVEAALSAHIGRMTIPERFYNLLASVRFPYFKECGVSDLPDDEVVLHVVPNDTPTQTRSPR